MFQTTNQQCFHINEQQILQEDLDVLTSPMEHHCWSGGKELQTQGMAGPMQSFWQILCHPLWMRMFPDIMKLSNSQCFFSLLMCLSIYTINNKNIIHVYV